MSRITENEIGLSRAFSSTENSMPTSVFIEGEMLLHVLKFVRSLLFRKKSVFEREKTH